MSTTPPCSESSSQTYYYDAVVMQFSMSTDDGAGEGQSAARANSVDPHSGALLASSGTSRSSQVEDMSSRVGNAAGQKTSSIRLPAENHQRARGTTTGRTDSDLGRKASVRTTASTRTTTPAFANGAPLAGVNAEPNVDRDLIARGADAERSLNQKQKEKIARDERRESKKFSKLLKIESTTEKVALDSALKSLSSLQGLHKAAIKRETKAQASHARALSVAQEAEGRYHEERARATEVHARMEARCTEERARWEGKEGQVRAQQERLDSARETVKETEARIAECAREVERLRTVKATDEREREAKLTELVGQK